MDFNRLIFLPLDIPNPPPVYEFWDTLSESDLIPDEYRTCHHVPIMDGKGVYTEIAHHTPELIAWLDEHVFTWADRSRIMIIRTKPGRHNAPHIDCSPDKFHTLQHKMRYVFRGRVESLYFIHDDTETRPLSVDAPYMMSGRWPHAMHNDTDKIKYTLALGAPWEPDPSEPVYRDLLERSVTRYADHYIEHTGWTLPNNWRELFQDRYTVDDNTRFDP